MMIGDRSIMLHGPETYPRRLFETICTTSDLAFTKKSNA
jgi:hypothetical protein